MLRKHIKNLVGAAALLATTTLAGPQAIAADADKDWSNINVTFVVWLPEDAEFFVPSIAGAKDAAADQGINLNIQYGDGDTAVMNNVIEVAIANKVDALAVSIWDDAAFDENVCKAVEAGIKVIIHNIDDSKGDAGRDCKLAYVGQDFVNAGYLIGKRMIADHGIGKGDTVFTPVEFPEAVYATKRREGVQKAIDEVGAATEPLGTGVDQANALNLLTQYLIGHPDTKAIIGLGVVPMSVAVKAASEAGVTVPVGGFDVSPPIIEGIDNATITATMDQQPYSQGYMAVTQLSQWVKYGLYPASMATGGIGLLDSSNVGIAADWAGKTR